MLPVSTTSVLILIASLATASGQTPTRKPLSTEPLTKWRETIVNPVRREA